MIDCGTIRANRVISPLNPSASRTAPVMTPLAASIAGLTAPVIASAAMAFIGCTGIGSR